MTIVELQDLLDTAGANPASWPPDKRGAAERLIAADPLAREALEKATRLDLLVVRALRADLPGALPADEAATGILNAFAAAELPPHRRGLLAWMPAQLLPDVGPAPAWPRVAALASIALLGFGIGLFGLDMTTIESFRGAAASTPVSDTDLSVVAFDPEPLTGVRP